MNGGAALPICPHDRLCSEALSWHCTMTANGATAPSSVNTWIHIGIIYLGAHEVNQKPSSFAEKRYHMRELTQGFHLFHSGKRCHVNAV